ncbi:MAG: MFS transporter [Phycisphaerae bacterium]|nr:MFS transporter [Phycisphaerae bacterium]
MTYRGATPTGAESARVVAAHETPRPSAPEVRSLRDITALQWKTAGAAWAGLLFDGLDAYLYVLVATPFVASLLGLPQSHTEVGHVGSWIQAAFLLGWAVGGTVFGWIGDHFGRSRTMSYTILLYGVCTGLSSFAGSWWQLLILRFFVGMGIGGEWAAGSALISETWPKHWRPWVSATLWSAYEVGMMLAAVTAIVMAAHPRFTFLIGVLPALGVYWIRRHIPEPEEWHAAKARAGRELPPIGDLFRGAVARTTILVTILCTIGILTAWLFLYWYPQQLRNLPELHDWSSAARTRYTSIAFFSTTAAALVGNFAAAALAHRLGYRRAIALMFVGAALGLLVTYGMRHGLIGIIVWLSVSNFFILGIFGLFPMYIPPLFPTLLRTTGAGFSYNVGRVVTSIGLVVFGLLVSVGDYGQALMWVSVLYVPAIVVACLLPEHADVRPSSATAA